MTFGESIVYRDSMLIGDRHIIRLVDSATGLSVEYEGKLPKDKRQDADARHFHRQKAWELLVKKINNKS
jgi:hypothetical protein